MCTGAETGETGETESEAGWVLGRGDVRWIESEGQREEQRNEERDRRECTEPGGSATSRDRTKHR